MSQKHKDCLKEISSKFNKLGLKKCPHCGEEEDIVIRTRTYEAVVPLGVEIAAIESNESEDILDCLIYHFVECLPCDAQTGWCFDEDAPIEGFKDGREMAIFYWNMRRGVTENNNLLGALNEIVNELTAMSEEEFNKILENHKNSDITLALINAWKHEEKDKVCQCEIDQYQQAMKKANKWFDTLKKHCKHHVDNFCQIPLELYDVPGVIVCLGKNCPLVKEKE